MRGSLTFILLATIMLWPLAPARSYTIQFTNSSTATQIRWPLGTVTVTLSSSLSSPPSNIKAGSDVVGAARRALERWSEAANIQFNVVLSPSDLGLISPSGAPDGISLITVSSQNGSAFSNTEMPGRARIFFNPATGEITESDIAINPAQQFSTDGTPGTFDLESTFMHEIGHLLGLEHSGVVGATMQPRQGRNGDYVLPSQTPRTLSDDDRAGLRAIYGSLSGTGEIRGLVTGGGGGPQFGAHIWAEDVSTGRVKASSITPADGSFGIRGLPPGQYNLIVEYLDEPIAAPEIASRNGAYLGLSNVTPFRTFEVPNQITVAADAITTFNIALAGGQPVLNPTLLGTNGRLSTMAVPLVPGTTTTVLIGGDNVHQVGANGINVTSPFITVNPSSVSHHSSLDPTRGLIQVLSFDVTVSIIAPPGGYSIRLLSNTGEVSYISGGLTVDLPNGMPTTNLMDDPQFFVSQNYRDFLNREADPQGLAFWTGQISSCGGDTACIEIKRINVSAAFFLSIEFQNTGYLTYRIYKSSFNRFPRLREFLPDTQQIGRGTVVGVGNWKSQLEENKQAFISEFVTRPAFTTQYPQTLSPAQFVDALNANTGGSLSQAERDALVNELSANNTTQGRASVLRRVVEDDDFEQREFKPAFVLMQYFGYLKRDPDSAPDNDLNGFNFWLEKLNQFNGNFVQAEMVKAFITSSEYRQRFGPP